MQFPRTRHQQQQRRRQHKNPLPAPQRQRRRQLQKITSVFSSARKRALRKTLRDKSPSRRKRAASTPKCATSRSSTPPQCCNTCVSPSFLSPPTAKASPPTTPRSSTTGSAPPTRDDVDLSHLQFAVFGLGNKTYEHYNSVGVTVDRRLAELGATRVVPLGLGDDDSSLEDDFAAWRANLLPPFAALAGIDSEAAAAEQSTHASFALREYAPPSSEAKRATANAATDTGGVGTSSTSPSKFDVKTPLAALHRSSIASCTASTATARADTSRSRPAVDCSTRWAIMSACSPRTSSPTSSGSPHASAPRSTQVVSLVEPDSNRVMLGPCTVRNALLRYVEINGAIRQSSLSLLLPHVTDDAERQRLRDWTAAGSESYARDVRDASAARCIEILADMPSLKPPLGVVLELLPRLAPRYYSISSAPAAHGTRIHVTAVVVRNTTSTGRIFTGLCTGFFARTAATPHQPVACFVRRSTFKLPRSLAAPLIMFGPGTGIAPFRGFIHDLRSRAASGHRRLPRPSTTRRVLYFRLPPAHDRWSLSSTSSTALAQRRHAVAAACGRVAPRRERRAQVCAACAARARQRRRRRRHSAARSVNRISVCVWRCARDGQRRARRALLHALAAKQLGGSKEQAEAVLTQNDSRESRYLKDVWY
jgi:sulfite reductase alpha subunit-like flavoprotein